MRTLLLSDLHVQDPFPLINKTPKIGRVIALGDYDLPELVEELLRLELPRVILVGNHDYPYVADIDNPEPKRPGFFPKYIDYERTLEKWRSSPLLRGYANTQNIQYHEAIQGRNFAYVHASIYEDENGEAQSQLSLRMFSWFQEHTSNIIANFLEMEEQDIWVLFRGHDGQPKTYSMPRESHSPKLEERFAITLEPDRRYIFTVGAFCKGHYAIFDDEKMRVYHRNLTLPPAEGK